MPSLTRSILKWTDRWKCQCLMIEKLALWMDDHKIFEKALEISATIVSFLTLILSVLSLRGKEEILIYKPAFKHFLLTSVQSVPSEDYLRQNCHYFDSLSHVKYVGVDRLMFYQIRIAILFVLWVTDMLGLFFSFVHPPCGTKMYIFGLITTLLFFVLFPPQLCINFGSQCIQYSPIFLIYRIEFMIQFNIAWLGIGAIGLIVVIYPITYLARNYCNLCFVDDLFFEIIYGIVCIPFFGIAIINFISGMWTSSAVINSLTLASTVINYFLYHASTTVRKQLIQRQKQVQRILGYSDKNYGNYQFYSEEVQADKIFKSQHLNSIDSLQLNFKKKRFNSPQKPERIKFYIQWQNRIYNEFHQI